MSSGNFFRFPMNSGYERVILKCGAQFWIRSSDRSIQPDPPHLLNLGLDPSTSKTLDKKAVKEAWRSKSQKNGVSDELKAAFEVLRHTESRAIHVHRNGPTREAAKHKAAIIALSSMTNS